MNLPLPVFPDVSDEIAKRGRVMAGLLMTKDTVTGEYRTADNGIFNWTKELLQYVLAIFEYNGCVAPSSASNTINSLKAKVDTMAADFVRRDLQARALPILASDIILDNVATNQIGLPTFVSPLDPIPSNITDTTPSLVPTPAGSTNTRARSTVVSSSSVTPAVAVPKTTKGRKKATVVPAVLDQSAAVTTGLGVSDNNGSGGNVLNTNIVNNNITQPANPVIPGNPVIPVNPTVPVNPVNPPNTVLNNPPNAVINNLLLGNNNEINADNLPDSKRAKKVIVYQNLEDFFNLVDDSASVLKDIVEAAGNYDSSLDDGNLTPAGIKVKSSINRAPSHTMKINSHIWIANQPIGNLANADGEYGPNTLAVNGMSLWRINAGSDAKTISATLVINLGNNLHACLQSSTTINFATPAYLNFISQTAFDKFNVNNILEKVVPVELKKLQYPARTGNIVTVASAADVSLASDAEFLFVVLDPVKLKPENRVLGTHGITVDPELLLKQLSYHAEINTNKMSTSSSSTSNPAVLNTEYELAFGYYNRLYNLIKDLAVILEPERLEILLRANASVADFNSFSILHFQKRDNLGNLPYPEHFDDFNSLLLNLENVFACLFSRHWRGFTEALRSRIQGELYQFNFSMSYIIYVFHQHFCNMLHLFKTGSLDVLPLTNLQAMVKIASTTFVNIPFNLREQAELAGGIKKSFNVDKFNIVIPSKIGKLRSIKNMVGAKTDLTGGTTVSTASTVAVNPVTVKAAKLAAQAPAHANNGHQKSGACTYLYSVTVTVIYFKLNMSCC